LRLALPTTISTPAHHVAHSPHVDPPEPPTFTPPTDLPPGTNNTLDAANAVARASRTQWHARIASLYYMRA